MLLNVVFSTDNTVSFTWRPTLTLSMQAIVVIENLFLGTTHSLVGTFSHGRVKNKMVSLSLSSVEAEYRSMIHASSEILWVCSFF